MKGSKILVFCQCGMRGRIAAQQLDRHGFDVTNLTGGWEAWSKE
jgi:rhodanese-related sulfurtransferase